MRGSSFLNAQYLSHTIVAINIKWYITVQSIKCWRIISHRFMYMRS